MKRGGNGEIKVKKEGKSGGKNDFWLPDLKGPGTKCRSLKKDCTISDLMDANSNLGMDEFRIGSKGTCQDFHLFGECKRFKCRFRHGETSAPELRIKCAVKALNAFAATLR